MCRIFLSIIFCLLTIGCFSNDPRLPEKLYDEAVSLGREGKTLESKALMEEIARLFPEKLEGMSAREDVFTLEAMLKRKADEEKKQVRQIIRSTCDALKRYRDRYGEYPTTLQKLVPEYGLDQIPLTPWKHPLFYRAFVSVPKEEITDRRGRATTKTNTHLDSYYLACLGQNLVPGEATDDEEILVVNGTIIQEKSFPPIPEPQPFRL
ncbi:MAG: type II secretion system protein GspG [Holophagaceae bacterium]|nr:type II secretion system protein GspG [Holophagaceae bacterium]